MTPREQIQEHARLAAAKIREAMDEFAEFAGCQAQVEVHWQTGNIKSIVIGVEVHIQEGFLS